MQYTVEQLTHENFLKDQKLIYFMYEAGQHLAHLYGDKFDWQNFPMKGYCTHARFMVCRRDGAVVGIMGSRLYPSILDPEIKILMQDFLYTLPQTRAVKMLMDDFIDFGKREANHTITMIAEKTNIKHRTLVNLGFKPIETLYRLET